MLPYLVFAAISVATTTPARSPAAPDVAGSFREADWRGARRARMVGGGELRLLRSGKDVYVAVLGATRGYPSLCVGNAQRVEILHASAALGTATYVRIGGVWRLQMPFAWHLRERTPDSLAPTLFDQARAGFYRQYRWLSTASRAGAPVRMFHIGLDDTRARLGVVFLDTETMRTAYWPASMGSGCRDLSLVKGDAPDRLMFDPAGWIRLDGIGR